MQRDVIRAQIGTALDWADQWEHDAQMNGSEGYSDIGFLLRRTAAKMERIAFDLPPTKDVAEPSPPPAVDEFRPG